jgi:two-component system, NarL family, invasion response regulator UvrY
MLNVLITDDHWIVRQGLRQILEDSAEVSIIDEAENGTELFEKIHTRDYHLILLDISLPGKSGLELLKEIKKIKPEVRVIMISIYPEDQYALSAVKSGASGYITKGRAADELIPAISEVIKGGNYFSGKFIRPMGSEQN